MRFLVRAYDTASASVLELAVDAESAQEASQRISGDQFVLSVKPAASGRRSGAALDVAWWCRELRTLVSAGMTVVEALETLNAQPLGRARSEVHAQLVSQLRQGQSLSEAMRSAQCFSPVLIAGVKAGERTSSLVEALDDYLRFHEMLEQLRKKVISAAIYPALVIGLATVITSFLLMVVMPRFSLMYTDLSGPVSPATRFLMTVSTVLVHHGWFVASAVAVLAILLATAWRVGYLGRIAAALMESVGPLRRRVDEFRLAKLYQSLALMFRGGYSLDDALAQCEGLGLGARFRGGIVAARAAVQRGQRVSAAFAGGGLTDDVSQRLLAVGERTGNFDRVLQTIAARHASNFSVFMERATRIVEPILLMVVAMVVGGIVVMMYMPVFDIAGSVR